MANTQLICHTRQACDLTQHDQLFDYLKQQQPNIIVNAAAFTHVDLAEQTPEQAHNINHHAVAVIAAYAKQYQARLIHFSSDYVFDGSSQHPDSEDDQPHPLSQYGLSKYLGEKAIRNSQCQHIIIRTSWLYHADTHHHNFFNTIIKQAQAHQPLRIVCDQIGTPNHVMRIAHTTHQLIKAAQKNINLNQNIYHISCTGQTSWYDYASFIIEYGNHIGLFQYHTHALSAITTKAYSNHTKRPAFSVLSNQTIEKKLNIHLPHWQIDVCDALTTRLTMTHAKSYPLFSS